jgi:hypothetical protein
MSLRYYQLSSAQWNVYSGGICDVVLFMRQVNDFPQPLQALWTTAAKQVQSG